MDGFDEGYMFFTQWARVYVAGCQGEKYVNDVNLEIKKLVEHLNAFENYLTDIKQLKGDIAEFWHSDTFNINAVAKGSINRTFVDRSHDFASADIISNFGEKFGLKYYKNATQSAIQQSKSIFERYIEYQKKGGEDTLEKFLSDRGFTDNYVLNDPIYMGQVRIIPKEQLEKACEWLKRKIVTESMKRPEQVARYQETLNMLSDRIRDNNGTESVVLSNKDATKLAILAKKGNITIEELAKLDISTEEIIKFEYIAKQAFKAGISAAMISLILKIAPEVYRAIDYLIKNGKLNKEEFQQIGFVALQGGTEGFVRGVISATIITSCKTGLLGESLKNITSEVVGMTVVLMMHTMEKAFKVATGKMTRKELVDQLVKELYILTFSYSFGVITQSIIEVPVFGFMLGSFIGSVAGAFTHNVMIGFCVETGFTMFGLIEQNYVIPKDILEEIGIETLDYEILEAKNVESDKFELDKFFTDSIEVEMINIKFLRRGIIEVTKVGYIY